MSHHGRCYCAAIEFQVDGAPRDVSICHCRDCQRHAGAPLVAWAGFNEARLRITRGTPKRIALSAEVSREFCGDCGSGLFYRHATLLPGVVEIQSVLFDDPAALVPTVQLQTAERISWMTQLHSIPGHARFGEDA